MALTEQDRAPRVVCAGTFDRATCGAAEGLVTALLEQTPRSLTLDCRAIVAVDVSGTGALLRIIGRCYEHGVPVDVLPSVATGDIADLMWPFSPSAWSFGNPRPGYPPAP
jgi:anti-anti-sigma regulatory factor